MYFSAHKFLIKNIFLPINVAVKNKILFLKRKIHYFVQKFTSKQAIFFEIDVKFLKKHEINPERHIFCIISLPIE